MGGSEDGMLSELIQEDTPERTVTYICDCFSSRQDQRNLSLHRAMNLRAGMSTNHIVNLKKELRGMDFAANDQSADIDIESYDRDERMDNLYEEQEEKEMIQQKIESIECNKKEWKDEMRILERKESANKLGEFANSLAMDILQESLAMEEQKLMNINKSI